MSHPRIDAGDLPAVDESTMREVDRRMEDEVGIDLTRMMENAGRGLAEGVVSLFAPTSAVVLFGSGGNGGGALVAARHLANRGVKVTIVASGGSLTPVPAAQRQILTQMGVLEHTGSTPPGADVIVDGMVGYSLRGAPTGRAAELAEWANRSPAKVVSLDVPTGFSAADGTMSTPHVAADATVTLALPKAGLFGADGVGRLLLADISVPAVVWDDLGLKVPKDLFARGQLVEVC